MRNWHVHINNSLNYFFPGTTGANCRSEWNEWRTTNRIQWTVGLLGCFPLQCCVLLRRGLVVACSVPLIDLSAVSGNGNLGPTQRDNGFVKNGWDWKVVLQIAIERKNDGRWPVSHWFAYVNMGLLFFAVGVPTNKQRADESNEIQNRKMVITLESA